MGARSPSLRGKHSRREEVDEAESQQLRRTHEHEDRHLGVPKRQLETFKDPANAVGICSRRQAEGRTRLVQNPCRLRQHLPQAGLVPNVFLRDSTTGYCVAARKEQERKLRHPSKIYPRGTRDIHNLEAATLGGFVE